MRSNAPASERPGYLRTSDYLNQADVPRTSHFPFFPPSPEEPIPQQAGRKERPFEKGLP